MKKDIVMAVFLLIFSIAGLLFFLDWNGERVCNNYSGVTKRQVKWKTLDACYIEKSEGVWIRYDSAYKE